MKQAWATGQWQTYSYDGDGQRVRRNVNDTETWQVYGIGGELVAEVRSQRFAHQSAKRIRVPQRTITCDGPGLSEHTLPGDGSTRHAANSSGSEWFVGECLSA